VLVFAGCGLLSGWLLIEKNSSELSNFGLPTYGVVYFVENDPRVISQRGHYVEFYYLVNGVMYRSEADIRGVDVGDTVHVVYSSNNPRVRSVTP
jgi:hypothetical protein